jgi:heat shock protein HspQ
MKYALSISGGITGIPKKYVGKVTLASPEQKRILETLNTPLLPKNEELRDGLHYHLQVQDDEKDYEANFDDTNLPLAIRNFISMILNKG